MCYINHPKLNNNFVIFFLIFLIKKMNISVYVPSHLGNSDIVKSFCTLNTNSNCKFNEFNLNQSKYWENDFFLWVNDNNDELKTPFIGFIVSHYKKKLGRNIDFYKESLNMGLNHFKGFKEESSDCLQYHKKGIFLMNQTLDLLGLKNNLYINTIRCTYYNYWIMSREALILYSKYVLYIKKLWENNITDEEFNLFSRVSKLNLPLLEREMNGNSEYINLPSKILQEKTGFKHYTYHTFLLERMHKIILVSNGFQCSDIIEYNPDVTVISAILTVGNVNYDIISKINYLFGTYTQFTVTNNFFPQITGNNVKLSISYTISNITNTINASFLNTLASIYWKRRTNI